MKRLATVLTLVAIAGCGEVPTSTPDSAVEPSFARTDNAPAVDVYRVDLDELNASGVKGTATLQVKKDQLVVTLNAVGYVPGLVHPQHVHGFAAMASRCPTPADDANGDGVITIGEGAAAFGPVQVDLRDYPTPANQAGSISYRRAFDLADVPFDPSDLPSKTMVLHGDFVDGAYVASLPVACGTVQGVN